MPNTVDELENTHEFPIDILYSPPPEMESLKEWLREIDRAHEANSN